MRRPLLALALVVLTATGSGILTPGLAAAGTITVTSGSTKVLFLRPNLDPVPDSAYATPDPYKTGPQFTPYQTTGLRDEIDSLVQAATAGSTLYASLYTFTDQAIADHLLAAHARGVRVRLLVEACTDGNPLVCDQSVQVDSLVSGLPAYASGATGSWVKQCYASCAGGGVGIDHNKFWVFSALSDGRTDVTIVGSNNPTNPQQQMYQNLVEVSGNAALATAYRDYAGRKAANTGTTKVYETGHVDAGAFRVWFSPRNSPSTGEDTEITSSFSPQSTRHDVFAAAVDDVQCSTTTTDDVIRMVMWSFRAARPEVIDALGDKADAGCTVEVATGEHQDAIAGLAARGVRVYSMDPGGCRQSFFNVGSEVNSECSDGSAHSKYLLTQGVSRKDNQTHAYVYTGSHNLTNGALKKNDETLIRINDATVYNGFAADYDAIKTAVIDIAPSRYPNSFFGTANASATGDQFEPAVASYRGADGHTISVVAFSSGLMTATGNEIRLGRFIDGVRQSEVVVRTGGNNGWDYKTPDVGLAANGDAVIVWADDSNGNGGYEIRSRRVHSDGTMTPIVNINSQADGDQSQPSVAVLADGRFAVTWEDLSTAGASSIRYASFSAADARLSTVAGGYDVPVQAVAGGTYHKPDVAVNASGTAVLAWEDDEDGNGGYSIRGITGTLAGVFGSIIAVHTGDLSDGQQWDPAVAIGSGGVWYAAWTDDYTGRTGSDGNPQQLIYVRGFTGSTAAFAARTVSGPIYKWSADTTGAYAVTTQTAYQSDRVGRQAHPDLAVDGTGNAVVTWHETGQTTGLTSASSGSEVWARGISTAGTSTNLFPESRLSVITANRQDDAAIGVDQNGTMTVVYVDDWDGNGGTQLYLRYGLRNCAQTC